ncbi:MAG TPA: glycosyltransferase [Verrucomicrobiae bacterium]
MNRNAFVFVVCGNHHAERARIALKFLRHFSRSEIIVVKSRTRQRFDADRVIDARTPSRLDNRQAAIFLKTSLHKILKPGPEKFCYLDNDVLAVNKDVDAVFNQFQAPISFGADHCSFRQFSRYAVHCGCVKSECDHLKTAIGRQFGVKITQKDWQHWNGGVFVFNETSTPFLDHWHENTLAIFKNPHWQARDQGTLAATAWQLKLQDHPRLPREFNFIVDPLIGVPRARRATAKPRELKPVETYSLQGDPTKPHPHLLHFINDGIGRRGWKNWDDAERLLAPPPKSPASLSPDNRIVHGLWIGTILSKMELLTLRSFVRQGHEFHLWAYDKIETPLPPGVIVEDANRIIPRSQIIKRADTDTETGVGKGSVSSPFSDLFRYKLLYEKGGYWVDMDVTCLRPLNFTAPYVFRPHRVGVVGNIIKCPPGSPLMKSVYQKVARIANEHTDWLLPNKILSQTIRRLKLTRYIRGGIWNPESWWDAIRPLALDTAPIPSDWMAIHWINEFWRTLKQSGGVYRGQRLFTVVPEKDQPKPGSALAKLYADYGLSQSAGLTNGAPAPIPMPLEKPADRQPATPQFLLSSHVNVLLPSLTRGGAERSVVETFGGLQRRNASGNLFVLYNAKPAYGFDGVGGVRICRLSALDIPAKLHSVAMEVLASPEPVLFTHMVKAEMLQSLWERGVKTVPVIQNSKPAWQDPPGAFKHPNVPFIVAVSEAVAEQLREAHCPKPVIVMRHEMQRWSTPEEQKQNRHLIRERYGIADDVLVVGMVGQFKSQKSYTRAVRVLARLRQIRPAKLMILGGWDSDWGHARQAYTATCRLALELDVITDLITPGPVPDAEKYYAAFDVFLSTSSFEGLSVSLLEAIQTGCPIVTADAGGNREVLPERAVLVRNPSDINAYVQGIAHALQSKSRVLVPKPADFDLVPRLWCLLGRYSRPDSFTPISERTGTFFVTDSLGMDAAPRILTDLLGHLSPGIPSWLCVLYNTPGQAHLDELRKKNVPVFSLQSCADYLERIERILSILGRLKVRNICFWNVDPRIKLLLAKILPKGTFHLIDICPNSSLFSQMEHSAVFQRRISFGAKDYWARIDRFVAKYHGGTPPNVSFKRGQLAVISDGVPVPATIEPAYHLLPGHADPNFILGTCCPIMPGKRIEFLVEMMTELNRQFKGATLVIIGGLDAHRTDYWPVLLETLRARAITNIHFAGSPADARPLAKLFKAFVAVSEWPGIPTGCLEAMALGIPIMTSGAQPVWAHPSRGKRAFAVHANSPQAAAQYARELFTDPALQRELGKAAKTAAVSDFSQAKMVRNYRQLFAGTMK